MSSLLRLELKPNRRFLRIHFDLDLLLFILSLVIWKWNNKRSYTFVVPWTRKSYPIPEQNGQNVYPFSDQNARRNHTIAPRAVRLTTTIIWVIETQWQSLRVPNRGQSKNSKLELFQRTNKTYTHYQCKTKNVDWKRNWNGRCVLTRVTRHRQPPPQALRFSHGRGERETRVTGDEPQGTKGRVQGVADRPWRPAENWPETWLTQFLNPSQGHQTTSSS